MAGGPTTARRPASAAQSSLASRRQPGARSRRPPSSRARKDSCRAAPHSTSTARLTSSPTGAPGRLARWARSAAAISARAHTASDVIACRQRLWQLDSREPAAARSSHSCGQPAAMSSSSARRAEGPAVLNAAAPETKGTGAWAGEVVSSSSPGCPTRHMWKGGGNAFFSRGSCKPCCAMKSIQSSLAARVRTSPASHCAGSRSPVSRKPGHRPNLAM